MTFEEIKNLDEQYVMHSYGRFPVAIDRGEGATLWDVDGKEYIDFTAGIGVASLGHGDQGWLEAVTRHLQSVLYRALRQSSGEAVYPHGDV